MTELTDKTLLVTDSSTTEEVPSREHFIIYNGEEIGVNFQYLKPSVVPYEVGMKFLGKQGFTVMENVDGLPLELPPVTPDSVAQSLNAGEVIAKLEELNDQALEFRVYQRLSGEQFLKVSQGREDNLRFLHGEAGVVEVTVNPEEVTDNFDLGTPEPEVLPILGDIPAEVTDVEPVLEDVPAKIIEGIDPEQTEEVIETTEEATEEV
jgi:hypothetical protein